MLSRQKSLPNKTFKRKETRANFEITSKEREILKELVEILESFEFVTNQLQGEKVSISKVYPCYYFLRTFLMPETSDDDVTPKFKYIIKIRKELLMSLKKRKNLNANKILKFFEDSVLLSKAS